MEKSLARQDVSPGSKLFALIDEEWIRADEKRFRA
jgi:hypothetical protein